MWRLFKYSIFRTAVAINTILRKIHLTPNALVRGDTRKHYLKAQENNLECPKDTLTSDKCMANFWGIESDEGVITVVDRKLDSLPKKLRRERFRETFHRKSFGIVRYDSDNDPKYHGQYGKKRDFTFPHTSDEYSFVSEESLKFKSRTAKTTINQSSVDDLNQNKRVLEPSLDMNNVNSSVMIEDSDLCAIKESESKDSYIDKYYFGNFLEEKTATQMQNNDNLPLKEELNFLDENFFGVSKNETVDQDWNFPKNNPLNCENSRKDHLRENIGTNHAKVSESDSFGVEHFSSNSTIKSLFVQNEENITVKKTYNQSNVVNPNNMHSRTLNPKINENFDDNINETDFEIPSKVDPKLYLKDNSSQMEDNEEILSESHEKLNYDALAYNNLPKTVKLKAKNLADTKNSQNIDSKELSEVKNEITAYDFVKNLQKEKEVPHKIVQTGNKLIDMKVDSKGFRILKNQVADLSYCTKEEIISLLKKNILYKDDDLVILDKPYSLVIHDSQTTRVPCLDTFLDELAQEINLEIDNPKLHTVHRLDKGTTGCLLLAKNESMAQYLKSLFAQRKIIKKYWIVTIRVPDPLEGVIDIPISEGSVDKKMRMVLHPDLPKDMGYRNHSKAGKQAVTSYKVLQQSGNAALVEAKPLTGIKHQIRVHFGLGLSCPILGDHKYSHLEKLAPQKLQCDLLQRLHVRQSKVRHIPLHIHAKSVTIPQYFEDRDLYVQAPLPKHIKENLKNLKFKKK